MNPKQKRRQGKGAIDLVEEATHLLRTAPAATLAAYYVGAIPFALGWLYFWADMSRSPFAAQHVASGSLGLTLMFLWMKFWQVIFARNVRAQLAAESPPPMSFQRSLRIVITQTILQPLGLFLIPLALLPLIPFAWIYSFFQNVTALADGNSVTRLAKKSWQQARLWPGQNNLALAITFVFGFYVFLNWVIVGYLLPQLAKMLFGVSSVFTESPSSLFNTTFFTGMIALTYLCVDPILKVLYVLRCFYGESLQSGADLKAELKPFARRAQKLTLMLVLLLVPAGALRLPAADTTPATSQVAPADLNQAIGQTIREQKYTWRMPREQILDTNANQGVFARFFDKVGTMLRGWARAFRDWWDALMKKLFPAQEPVTSHSPAASGYGWILSLQIFLYALVAGALAALAIFLYRVWQGRQQSLATPSEAIQPVPDIADENVRADQLPEESWRQLARELVERGEFRLALRAFYLASLAHLATKNLIRIARFKSNHDYERELRRRAHGYPQLLSIFDDNLFTFERIWYGTHAANREVVEQFAANVDKIKVGA